GSARRVVAALAARAARARARPAATRARLARVSRIRHRQARAGALGRAPLRGRARRGVRRSGRGRVRRHRRGGRRARGRRAMKAEVLTIGDELLRGEIVDSNKAFLSDRLLSLDIETHYHASVRDVPADMIDAFRRAAERSDIVLVSGGLGPTRDDLTSQSLAAAFGR